MVPAARRPVPRVSRDLRGCRARLLQDAGTPVLVSRPRTWGRADLERLSGANRTGMGPPIARPGEYPTNPGLRAFRGDRRDPHLVRPALHKYPTDSNGLARRIPRAVSAFPAPAVAPPVLRRSLLRGAAALRP